MRTLSVIIISLLFPLFGMAGNIEVTNVALTNQNTTNDTYQVEFDLAWENSWRTSTFESNWDAAWVVIKFRETPSIIWEQTSISLAGTTLPSGTEATFGGDDGFFIYRSADGIGDFNATGISVRWNYGTSIPDDAIIEVCVLAIEMVYIPEGAFEVGDDSDDPEANFQAGVTTNPYTISSENAITLGGNSSANLNVRNDAVLNPDDYSTSATQTLPTEYPKGFSAFYTMKYEISQQQYVDFLNKLPTAAAENRFPNRDGSNGHTISNTGSLPELYVTTTPDRACNWLSWSDIAAYADWIALRPMSELEYEKASRGTRDAVPDEKAWGSPFISTEAYTVASIGTPSELISNPSEGTGNANYSVTDILNRPYRCGIFAASAVNKTREETGASYYGVMELSGNIWELTISTGDPEGRAFNGANNGNGIVSSAGNSTVGTWPPITGANDADGTGVRGGGVNNPALELSISNRALANLPIDGRFNDVGGRLVRTVAP